MEENRDNEMTVDELLKKLKDDILGSDEDLHTAELEQKDVQTTEAAADSDAAGDSEIDLSEEFEALLTEKSSNIDHRKETNTVEMNIPKPAADKVEAHETFAGEAEMDEPAPLSAVNEEDILAAWGIARGELEKNKQNVSSVGKTETEPLSETINTKHTRVYTIARIENKEAYALRKQSETQQQAVDYDRTDYTLIKQALGMEKADAWEPDTDMPEFEAVSENRISKIPKTIDSPKDEFTYQRQRDDIAADYKRWSKNSGLKLLLALLAELLLFALECLPALGVTMPDALNPAYYPVVYSMASLQLLLILSALCYRELANGALSLLKFRITGDSVLVLAVLFTVICDIVSCAFGSTAPIYNFSAGLCALSVKLFDYLDIRRQKLAFDIISSDAAQKYVAVKALPGEMAGIVGMEDYTNGEDAQVLRVEKCSFVENYFARTDSRSERDVGINRVLVPIIFAVAVVAFIFSMAGGDRVDASFGVFNAVIMLGLPATLFLSASYPLYKASKQLYKKESAIVGETSVEEYAGTTLICFDDADAFPSYGVALENLRIYGKGDIETIIEQMGALFSRLGGPLKHVFSLMTTDCPKPYRIKLEQVFEDGVCALVDGEILYVGNADYMKKNGFCVTDRSDEIGGKHFSTMYLAQDGELRAKFFIRYTLDGGFESIVRRLAKHGVASVILTGDSNISDELLARFIDISKLPVKVVRRRNFENGVRGGRADSGVVSKGGVGDLVHAVTICDRVSRVISTMKAVRIASAAICALLTVFLCFMNLSGTISSLYTAIYQLFWLVPALIIAKVCL